MSMKAESLRAQMSTSRATPTESPDLAALFDGHIAREFADQDVDATMETMVPEPYVHCVAIMTGGFGHEGVRRFYSEHFINQIPKDVTVTPISRTVGKDCVVDEFIISFTHDTQWDYLLPGVPPTGKRVELPHVVVMKFENGKVAHEHIYWDQASLLVQVGLLDPANLAVAGVEQARELLGAAQKDRAATSKPTPEEDEMQKEILVSEIPIVREASEGVVLRVLANLKNGRIEDALVGFAEEFRFKDHGIGLEFKDKQRLAEFFYKTRELYPDSVLHTDTIFDADNRVITEWTLRFTLTEPFYGGLKRTVKVFVHGASIVRIENGKISDWADYYDGLTSRRTALASFFTEWIEL